MNDCWGNGERVVGIYCNPPGEVAAIGPGPRVELWRDVGCWEVEPTGVTGGDGEGKAGVTPGFLAGAAE